MPESPAQRTFLTLKTEVARYVLGPSDTDVLSVAGDGINDGIRRLNTRFWAWSLTTQDITLVADTAEYTLADRFLAPRATELLDSASVVRQSGLDFYPPKTFSELFFDRKTSGTPGAYTVFSFHETLKLTLDVPCGSGFVTQFPKLRVHHYQRTIYLSADGDTLDAPSEVESFVVWWARWYTALHWAPEKASAARREAEDLWRMLAISDVRQQLSDWPAGVF